MGEEHKLLFDFSLPWEWEFWLPDRKKTPTTQTQENPIVEKKGELEAIFSSSASFLVTLDLAASFSLIP